MGSRRELVKSTATHKGRNAAISIAGTLGVTIAFAAIGAPLIMTLAAIAGGGYSSMKVYDWLRYRGEHGLKF